LIELLVVIVILGVLAAIVVFAVGGVTDKGKASACKTDLKSVEVAEEAYFSKNNVYVPIATLTAPPKPLLREAPNSPHYAINVDTTTGAVTSSPACSAL
jgi:general secretion pathway protein G